MHHSFPHQKNRAAMDGAVSNYANFTEETVQRGKECFPIYCWILIGPNLWLLSRRCHFTISCFCSDSKSRRRHAKRGCSLKCRCAELQDQWLIGPNTLFSKGEVIIFLKQSKYTITLEMVGRRIYSLFAWGFFNWFSSPFFRALFYS